MKTGMEQPLPLARKEELVIRELPDELLVYDLKNNKAHCLNHTAALVWKHCDGKKTVTDRGRVKSCGNNFRASSLIVA